MNNEGNFDYYAGSTNKIYSLNINGQEIEETKRADGSLPGTEHLYHFNELILSVEGKTPIIVVMRDPDQNPTDVTPAGIPCKGVRLTLVTSCACCSSMQPGT